MRQWSEDTSDGVIEEAERSGAPRRRRSCPASRNDHRPWICRKGDPRAKAAASRGSGLKRCHATTCTRAMAIAAGSLACTASRRPTTWPRRSSSRRASRMSRSSFGAIPGALPASKGSSGERAAACRPNGFAGRVASRGKLRQARAKRSKYFGAGAASALAAESRGAGLLDRARFG